jgi:hypothetical protein
LKFIRCLRAIAVVLSIQILLASLIGCDSGQSDNREVDERMAEKIPYEFKVAETYKNPMEIAGQHGVCQYTAGKEYGIGDPFVMRYNGKYYLYPSSCENKVKVFESTDLVNWEYKGYVTEGSDVYFAYAPEVVYYDGMFYMTTSPEGKGHYILKSESPLGPFKRITDNFGHVIDGSFWIDDDDRLLFIFPEASIIKAAEIDTKTMLPVAKRTHFNATLKGWTEGPGIFRRGEYHYLTYTGNHVLSRGYRVAYSYTKGNNPLGQYIMPEDNILYIRSEHDDEYTGLGHSSNVIGPDLDSIYAPYHNLVGLAGPQRRYCLDRLLTNGSVVYSTGPTSFDVPIPAMPEIYGWLDDPKDTAAEKHFVINDDGVTSKNEVQDVFTAEYNFRLDGSEKSPVDLKFGIKGASWWAVRVDTEKNTLSLLSVEDGNEKLIASEKIHVSHGYTRLCTVRVENTAAVSYIYFNSARKLTVKNAGITGGKVGASGRGVTFGYIGANSDALGSGDYEAVKNIPGKFAAMHYIKGENRGFNISKAALKPEGIRYGEKENSILNKDGSYSLVLDTPGDYVVYAVNVSSDGMYSIGAKLAPESSGAVYELIMDGDTEQTYRFTVPETEGVKTDNVSVNLGTLPLKAGFHTLTLRLVEGEMKVNMFEFYSSAKEPWAYKSVFKINEDRKDWIFYGPWRMSSGKLTIGEGNSGFAFIGETGMNDYVIEADVDIPRKGAGDSGLMFRVTNPSIMEHQVRESFIGYGISIGDGSITFSKYNYGKIGNSQIVSIKEIKGSDKVKLKVVVSNNIFQIYINDQEKPVLEYMDAQAWLHGKVGFYSFGKELTVNNLSVVSIDNEK